MSQTVEKCCGCVPARRLGHIEDFFLVKFLHHRKRQTMMRTQAVATKLRSTHETMTMSDPLLLQLCSQQRDPLMRSCQLASHCE